MRKESFEFLKRIQETPSPSGFEQPVQRVIRERMKPFADSITTDVHGNVVVGLNPEGSPRVMLAGHCDQIGMMVKFIDESGFLFFSPIGGVDPAMVLGARVVVHTEHGPVDGVVGRKPFGLTKPEDRGGKIELREMWVDIGARSKKDAQQVVRVGDPITFHLALIQLGRDLVASPALDNKCGTFVVMEVVRLCSVKKLKCALFGVSTVQEEIGLRGARTSCYGVDPQVGIAVDVTHASDCPDIDKRTAGEVKLGAGPTIVRGANINVRLEAMFERTAKTKRMPVQREGTPGGTATDANVMQLSRSGVATALIGIPNRYMHSPVEVISLSDLTVAAKLIAETVVKIDERSSFVPE